MTTHGLHCAGTHEDDSTEQLEHAAQLEEKNAIAELALQTPVEIDTALYALYREHLDLRVKREHAVVSLRHTVGDKHDYYNKTWGMETSDVLAYLRPVGAKDETLFVKPDVNGEAGVHVHDYDQLRQVIKGKSAHRFDYDTGEFKRAKVHRWEHSDAMPDGTHRRVWQYPAGGDLGDAQRTT